MEDLIKALEGAEGGSRELDADIYEALGFEVKRRAEWLGGRRFTRAYAFLRDSRWEAMGHLTTSVDDAMRLIRRPGDWWRIDQTGARQFQAVISSKGESNHAFCATPALALCAALLRARQSTEGEGA